MVVGEHQVQARDDRAGHKLVEVALVEGQQFIDTARRAVSQLVVGGQGGLHIEIEQQHAQPGVRSETTQVRSRGGLADPTFG